MAISLIEADDTPGNLEQVEKDLAEAVQERARAATAPQKRQDEAPRVEDDEDAELPERMRGKSKREIAEMYRNLESQYGRVTNDLGVQRKLTDRLLDLKRESDLHENTPTPVKVDASDLLDKPAETIERLLENYLSRKEKVQSQKLQELEIQLQSQSFLTKHPDYQEIANDTEFHQFVRGTPYRARLADAAMNGDYGAADELVTEFKDRRKLVSKPKQDAESRLEAAQKAQLESPSGRTSRSKAAGKVYRRADLLALQMQKPEAYYDEGFQEELLRAYAEGRVK